MNKAVLSRCKTYRYQLERHASGHAPNGTLLWVMLNPSTADAEQDDPTIRRVIDFTRRFGFRDLIVVNLFALRATDPKELAKADDPEGPQNGHYVIEAWKRSSAVVAAWGASMPAKWKREPPGVMKLFEGRSIWCLGVNDSDGSPKHPLMLAKTTQVEPFKVTIASDQ